MGPKSLIIQVTLVGCLLGQACDGPRKQSRDVRVPSLNNTSAQSRTWEPTVKKSEEEWKKDLTGEQYYILREKGTERAFTGAYYNKKEPGVYYCAGCGSLLFKSDHKFESGTGWPSFYKPGEESNIATETDESHGMVRTEVLCRVCGGHLGHVFKDGPAPTGLRYCINSAALKFEEK